MWGSTYHVRIQGKASFVAMHVIDAAHGSELLRRGFLLCSLCTLVCTLHVSIGSTELELIDPLVAHRAGRQYSSVEQVQLYVLPIDEFLYGTLHAAELRDHRPSASERSII